MIWMAVSVGRPAARALLYPICAYYVLFSRHAGRAIQPYLIRALGRPIGRRDMYRQFHCFASTLLDRVYLFTGQASHFDIDIRGLDILKDCLARGRGCILLGSHLGSFEIVRAISKLPRCEPSRIHPRPRAKQSLSMSSPRISMSKWLACPV